MTQRCSICGHDKPLEAFHRRTLYHPEGRRSECKDCRRTDKIPELHGPAFAEWLESRGIRARDLDPNRRVMGLWKSGRRVRLSTADSYLTRLGMHFSEVPEHIFIDFAGDTARSLAGDRAGSGGCSPAPKADAPEPNPLSASPTTSDSPHSQSVASSSRPSGPAHSLSPYDLDISGA